MALTVTLNGSERTFPALNESAAISDLVQELGVKPDRVAVEQNGAIVSRKVWRETQLHSGDRVEVVHFVGGGRS